MHVEKLYFLVPVTTSFCKNSFDNNHEAENWQNIQISKNQDQTHLTEQLLEYCSSMYFLKPLRQKKNIKYCHVLDSVMGIAELGCLFGEKPLRRQFLIHSSHKKRFAFKRNFLESEGRFLVPNQPNQQINGGNEIKIRNFCIPMHSEMYIYIALLFEISVSSRSQMFFNIGVLQNFAG